MLGMMGARHAYDGVHRRFLDEVTTNISTRHTHRLVPGQEVRGPEMIRHRCQQARKRQIEATEQQAMKRRGMSVSIDE